MRVSSGGNFSTGTALTSLAAWRKREAILKLIVDRFRRGWLGVVRGYGDI
jgi:hypothetical protein